METANFSSVIDISYEDSVEVYNIATDTANSIITFNITVYYGSSFSGYKGEIRSFAPHYPDTGWTASLFNSSLTDTLWQYEFKYDLDDPTWVGINEIADGDEFYLEIKESGGSYIETFYQNSDTLIISYDTTLLVGMRGDTSGYSQQDKDLIDSLSQQFVNYYDTTLAVNYNNDGELLSYLLASDDFWDIISNRLYGDHPPEGVGYRDNEVSKVCYLAGVGSYKCNFGIWWNPICVASLGVGAACAITGAYAWISGTWNEIFN